MAEKTVVLGNTDDASYQSGTIASANQNCTLAKEPDKQNLEQLAQEILALKQASLEHTNNHHREMQKLRGYLRWLTGILLVAILGLGGSFIGVTYSLSNEQIRLRNEQNKIAQQVETIADNQVSIQQFEQLKTSSDPLPENTPMPNSTSSEAVGGSTDGLNTSP